MSNLKELKTQIENANALGRQNLTEKGVEISETATTFEIMSKIADIVGGSGGEIKNNYTLLLHCDDFIDSGKYDHTLINNGVDIDTTVKKFGSGSMLFNSTSDYIDIDKSNFHFIDNDFTIDFWAFPTAFTGMILASWGNLGEYTFGILTSSKGELQFAYGVANGSSRKTAVLSTGSYLNLNVWQHIAITRTNDTLYFFINGNLVYSVAFTVPLLPPVNNLWIGKNNDNTFFGSDRYTGYLDEIRIINGECMWTEAFTPPEEPYVVETESGIELLDHTVTFTVDGEPYEIVSVKNGNSVNAPDTSPKKDGMVLIGWLIDGAKQELPFVPVSNIELVGYFSAGTKELEKTNTDVFLQVDYYAYSKANNEVSVLGKYFLNGYTNPLVVSRTYDGALITRNGKAVGGTPSTISIDGETWYYYCGYGHGTEGSLMQDNTVDINKYVNDVSFEEAAQTLIKIYLGHIPLIEETN